MNIRPSPLPPAIPISASLASPGPLTTQPITATLIFLLQFKSLFSTSSAMDIKSIFVLPQVGQDTNSIPSFTYPRDLNISFPILISSSGSPVIDTLIVSPIPSASRVPIPTLDFIVPLNVVPASVTPKCKG